MTNSCAGSGAAWKRWGQNQAGPGTDRDDRPDIRRLQPRAGGRDLWQRWWTGRSGTCRILFGDRLRPAATHTSWPLGNQSRRSASGAETRLQVRYKALAGKRKNQHRTRRHGRPARDDTGESIAAKTPRGGLKRRRMAMPNSWVVGWVVLCWVAFGIPWVQFRVQECRYPANQPSGGRHITTLFFTETCVLITWVTKLCGDGIPGATVPPGLTECIGAGPATGAEVTSDKSTSQIKTVSSRLLGALAEIELRLGRGRRWRGTDNDPPVKTDSYAASPMSTVAVALDTVAIWCQNHHQNGWFRVQRCQVPPQSVKLNAR